MAAVDLPVAFYRRGWFIWAGAFLVLETLALLDDKPGDTLTENIRPVFHAHPLMWFLTAGFLAWLPIHFLAPRFERWLSQHLQ